jgi:hypothetical protein
MGGQAPGKLHVPNTKALARFLELEVWSFRGAWSLGFGASAKALPWSLEPGIWSFIEAFLARERMRLKTVAKSPITLGVIQC